MKVLVRILPLLSVFCTSLAASPLDSVSSNLRSHINSSIDERDAQSVVVRKYETENDKWLTWSGILSPEWKVGTLANGRGVLEKRYVAFWLRHGEAPLAERFSMALEIPHQERTFASYDRGEIYQADPVVLQIDGYSNVVEFVSSLVKAKSKMDQWMELAFTREITNLSKRIPSISFTISDITDAMPRKGDYFVSDHGVAYDSGFKPVSYNVLSGFNVHGAFFYTMIINAKPTGGDRHPERDKYKPFLVLSTEKRYLRYVANYLESVKGKRIDQFGAIEKNYELLALVSSSTTDSWIELDDGTCLLPEFKTKRIMADTTVLVPKALMSYNDVANLIPLLNPNTAARELQHLRQQHSKENSLHNKSNDLFR